MYEKFFNKEFNLKQVKYSEISNHLTLKIITENDLNELDKENYISELKKYIGLDIQYDIQLKKSLSNDELVCEVEKTISKYKIGDNPLFEKCSYRIENGATYLNLQLSKDRIGTSIVM